RTSLPGVRGRRMSADDEANAVILAEELDGLALALEQAGAFIVARSTTLADYLARWKASETGLSEWHHAREMKYPRCLAITWQTTFLELSIEAQCLLKILSFFDSTSLPRRMVLGPGPASVLYSTTKDQSKGIIATLSKGLGALTQHIAKHFRSSEVDPPSVDEYLSQLPKANAEAAIEELISFSFLRPTDGEEGDYAIHRVLQSVVNQSLNQSDRKEFSTAAAMFLSFTVASCSAQDAYEWKIWRRLAPHVRKILVDEVCVAELDILTMPLMIQLGCYCYQSGLYAEAEHWLKKVSAPDSSAPKSEQEVYTKTLVNLATVAGQTADFQRAEDLYNQALLRLDQVPEGCLEEIAGLENNLGRLAYEQGKWQDARKLLSLSLSRLHGSRSAAEATALNNLGLVDFEERKFNAAETCFRTALEIEVELFGESHPATARTMQNLGRVLRDRKQFDEARNLFQRSIDINLEFYGTDHPDLARTYSNLGQLEQQVEKYAEAERCFEESLRIHQLVHGDKHPSIAIALVNIGNLYVMQKRFDDAVKLFQKAMVIDEAVFGPDHYEVSTDLLNLAMAKMGLKEFPAAKRHLIRAREIRVKCHGEQHATVRELDQLFRMVDLALGSSISQTSKRVQQRKLANRVGRNQRCPCGSGKKFKNCCGSRN
ncbi:MAG: tetratricopeptide repeat protein, partial [Planctomycetales bacterium]|nr:tetratricopeptide repeat protein [Planctomycetales bacterium]